MPGRRGCLPAGRSQAQEADGAELRGERSPAVGPQKLRAGTFEQPSPGAEPTWLEPESAAAKGSPGRGVYKPVPGLRSTERKGSLCRVQRLELQGASHGSVPFTQVCSHVPALSAVPPTLLLLHLKLCLQACQTSEIIEASPPTPSPALLSWNQPRFSSQSFALLVACGFPHSNLWFGVAQRVVSIFSLSLHSQGWFLYRI